MNAHRTTYGKCSVIMFKLDLGLMAEIFWERYFLGAQRSYPDGDGMRDDNCTHRKTRCVLKAALLSYMTSKKLC